MLWIEVSDEDRDDRDVSSWLSLDPLEPHITLLLTLIVSALKEFRVRDETCLSISSNH